MSFLDEVTYAQRPLSIPEETQFQYSNHKRFKKSWIWRGSSLGLSSKLASLMATEAFCSLDRYLYHGSLAR